MFSDLAYDKKFDSWKKKIILINTQYVGYMPKFIETNHVRKCE